MGTVSTTTFVTGTAALASAVNANFDAILAAINGGIEAVNLATGAVTEAKIGAGAVTDVKVAAGIDAAKVGGGLVSNTEFGYLNGVTSAIQTQLDAPVTTADIASMAVTPALTSFAAQLSASGKIYAGRIFSDGTAAILPSGWSSSRTGTGVYQITHSLGSSSYLVVITTTPSVFSAASLPASMITDQSINTFTIQTYLHNVSASTSAADNVTWNFILIRV